MVVVAAAVVALCPAVNLLLLSEMLLPRPALTGALPASVPSDVLSTLITLVSTPSYRALSLRHDVSASHVAVFVFVFVFVFGM